MNVSSLVGLSECGEKNTEVDNGNRSEERDLTPAFGGPASTVRFDWLVESVEINVLTVPFQGRKYCPQRKNDDID